MATADTLLRVVDPQPDTLLKVFNPHAVPERWRADADSKSSQDSDAFVNEAIQLLNNSQMVDEFERNVSQVGVWANEIDAAFDRVTRSFVEIVARDGAAFPELSNFLTEWRGYNQQWAQNLLLSRDVSSESVTILRRFDRVFLDMVMHIQTDQDRKDVIVELTHLIEEDHPNAAKMSRAFVDLARDIEDFVRRLDAYVERMGVALLEEARVLQAQIHSLQEQISGLDKQINDTRIALAVSGGLLNIIGLITASSLLAHYQSQRNQRNNELQERQRELADINRRQQSLANLKTDIDGLRPDIALICERLVLFAEIWSSVQSQSIQFRGHLEGGMEAATNMRFRREIQLAQDTCAPLMAGLERYATELRPRGTN